MGGQRVMKVKATFRLSDLRSFGSPDVQQGPILIMCERDLRLSAFAGTRKMVNFAWVG